MEAPAMDVVLGHDGSQEGRDLVHQLAEHGVRVLAEADDDQSIAAEAVRHKPELCLIDLDIRGDAIRAAATIRASLPDSAVIALARPEHDDRFFDVLRAGAIGYLPKGMDPARLANALRGVLGGEAAIPRRLIPRLIGQCRSSLARNHFESSGLGTLTDREWQILEMLVDGRTTADVARELYVSKVTVRTHISAVLRKLGVPDRAAAIRLYRGC